MTNRFIALSIIGVVAVATSVTSASAGNSRMLSLDETKGGKVVDNGVKDGRICKISWGSKWDKWTESFVRVKKKECL